MRDAIPDWFLALTTLWINIVQKPMPESMIRSYWLMLNDIPQADLQQGMIAVMKSHPYQSFPMPGAVRLYVDNLIGPMESLKMARDAVNRAGGSWASREDMQRETAALPARVRTSLYLMGWQRMCDGTNIDAAWQNAWKEALTASSRVAGVSQSCIPIPNFSLNKGTVTDHGN